MEILILLGMMGTLCWVLYIAAKTIKTLKLDITKRDAAFAKLLGQKKSSEVKLGYIAEKLAPFLDNFPCSVKDIQFLGQPIDFVSFEEDGVHFIEVKSGDAKLSPKQKHIRDQILAKKVHWHVMRIK
jgi:predicted Holliday junction resolvase-like endonuclease